MAELSPPNLDTLPVEVIRHIVSAGPCESALSLLRVNRALYMAVNDWTVFRDVIDNGNLSSMDVFLPEYSDAINALPVTSGDFQIPYEHSSLSGYKQYALADSKAIALFAGRDGSRSGHSETSLDRLEDWGPMLAITGRTYRYFSSDPGIYYPSHDHAFEIDVSKLIEPTDRTSEITSAGVKVSLGFLFAARMLTAPVRISLERIWILKNLNAMGIEKVDPEYHPVEKVLTGISDTITRCLFTSGRGAAFLSLRNPHEVSETYAAAYKGLSVFYHLLKHHIYRQQQQTTTTTTTVDEQVINPPDITTIPFLSFMNVPAPFSRPDVSEFFSLCHIWHMCTPDFLTHNSWVGYYTYTYQFDALDVQHRNRRVFDPPMTNINFVVEHIRPRSPGESEQMCIRAKDCVDQCGTFDIVGEVTTDVGRVTMRKEYVDGAARGNFWQYNGLLTPFGIVGSWSRSGSPGEGWGGWFWMWKSDWSASGSEEGWEG